MIFLARCYESLTRGMVPHLGEFVFRLERRPARDSVGAADLGMLVLASPIRILRFPLILAALYGSLDSRCEMQDLANKRS